MLLLKVVNKTPKVLISKQTMGIQWSSYCLKEA